MKEFNRSGNVIDRVFWEVIRAVHSMTRDYVVMAFEQVSVINKELQ